MKSEARSCCDGPLASDRRRRVVEAHPYVAKRRCPRIPPSKHAGTCHVPPFHSGPESTYARIHLYRVAAGRLRPENPTGIFTLVNTTEVFGVQVECVVPCGVRAEGCSHHVQLYFAQMASESMCTALHAGQ